MTAQVARHTILIAAMAGAVLSAGPAFAGCHSTECYRRVNTPPVFGMVSEQRLVSPPRTVYRSVPPVYDTVSEHVMVSPGGRHWQQSYDAHGQLVGCWVTTPPRYATTTRRVLVRPAEVVPETLPPVYANDSRRVLVRPGGAAWVPAGSGYGVLGAPLVGSIPDAVGITGASSADVGVGLGFSSGSIYDGY